MIASSVLQLFMAWCDYSNSAYTKESRNQCLGSISNCELLVGIKLTGNETKIRWCIKNSRKLLREDK